MRSIPAGDVGDAPKLSSLDAKSERCPPASRGHELIDVIVDTLTRGAPRRGGPASIASDPRAAHLPQPRRFGHPPSRPERLRPGTRSCSVNGLLGVEERRLPDSETVKSASDVPAGHRPERKWWSSRRFAFEPQLPVQSS